MPEITIVEKAIQKPKKPGSFDWREHVISHDSLLNKELTPLEYLVDGLIVCPSLGILAAPKKRAKSWMALQLSQSVASGQPFLSMATKQGSVIHMALEDGERRLRQRLEMQHTVPGLPICYVTKFAPLNSREGFAALKDLIHEQSPSLLVIDTLAAAKNRLIDENSAGDTADLFNHLHDLATTANMVILVIAHHGKVSNGDAGFDIRGSSAIPGATDVNIGLYKNEDGTFDLKAEGRDIGEVDMRIKFDQAETWSWQYQGEAKDVRREEAENRILAAVDFLGGSVEAGLIAEELGLNRSTVQTQLQRMRNVGLVAYKLEKVGRQSKCLYSRPPTSSTSSISPIREHHQHILERVGDVGDDTSSGIESKRVEGVDDVGDDSAAILGMSVDEALSVWHRNGAPLIHVPGGNITDLELFLSRPDQPEDHLVAVKAWLESNR